MDTEGLRSVTGYFDSALLPRQLGLQVLVQPHQVGPFTFGYSTAVQSSRQTIPGALSLTSLVLRDAAEADIVRSYSRKIAPEMLHMRGFISFLGIVVGQRMITLSAWDSPEDPKQLLRGGTHHLSCPLRRVWQDASPDSPHQLLCVRRAAHHSR